MTVTLCCCRLSATRVRMFHDAPQVAAVIADHLYLAMDLIAD